MLVVAITTTVGQLPFKLGMAKIFNMAKMCLKPKKRHTAPVPFQYKKKFLGVGGLEAPRARVTRTLRAAASRGALCAAPGGGNIENRSKHRRARVPTRQTNT
jgi:hypothetical protein